MQAYALLPAQMAQMAQNELKIVPFANSQTQFLILLSTDAVT